MGRRYIAQVADTALSTNLTKYKGSFTLFIHMITGFHESEFPCLFCLKLHDFTSFKPIFFSGGGPPDPPPLCDTNTVYNAKTIM